MTGLDWREKSILVVMKEEGITSYDEEEKKHGTLGKDWGNTRVSLKETNIHTGQTGWGQVREDLDGQVEDLKI